MSDVLYKKLYSYKNLELAWTRIKTAQNIQYKNYYRSLFLAYELAKNKNLERLAERIKGKSYAPSQIVRFYIPKPSGLHRPISFLYLDDIIVYQAFANIIADKFCEKRALVENINVFSNILNRDEDKNIFFLKKWQEGYSKFRSAIKAHFIGGSEWVAHFDISAYYDTISHTALSQQISRKSYQDFKELLDKCLKEWSSSKNEKVGHGIPQGPIASDLIGEIYLLPIDIVLNKHKIKYVRYVDDIKIFGETRREVLNGVLLLERECKERGLIPHAKKYEIIKAKSVDDAIGKYPSLTTKERNIISTDTAETAKLFQIAFEPERFDISKIKYILKSSPHNKEILKIILDNLTQHPELVDEFCIFLSHYKYSDKIGQKIYKQVLSKQPYFDYVEGKYWELISMFSIEKKEKDRLICEAIKRLKKGKDSYPLRYGIYRFIASTGNSLILKWLDKEKSSFIQMLVANHISHLCYNKPDFIDFVNRLMRRSNYEPALVCIKQLVFSFNYDVIKKLDKPSKDYSGVLHNMLGKSEKIDPIGQILSKRYGITYTKKWSLLISDDYEHANECIFLADKAYYIDRNSWISHTDSFNDIVIRKFIALLATKVSLPSGKSWPKTINSLGENVKYGILLDPKNQLSVHYPLVVNGLRKFHNRRSKTPSAHAYDEKTGVKTTIITGKEQKNLVVDLKTSYENIVVEIEKFL